ncbi:hypothetical protein PHYBOEH_007207 [Phytophthora boehmeriae]|uniref:C3H1-type domain-containing protein n=1 Tax=Phytophthora boehmeriae TaxID=109152 RepID=A0A8T1W7G5_9STRA|nr:hypothetical protein PHYBOEH_007207 [Phytophthora boehmeriae]
MAAAGSSAEPQREPASEEPDSSQHAAPAPPGTGELLGRVATQINEAFQSSLVQVVSDIGREYGLDPSTKYAWMEKGGAAVALSDEQLNTEGGGEERGQLSENVRRILRELQASRLQVRELQQVVDELREEQRLSIQRVALFGTLSTKLKRELVNERLALIDAKNEVKELRRSLRRSGDDAGSGGGRSPQSPSLQEKNDNPWSSPDKPIAGSSSGGTGATSGAGGSNLMAFNFYSASRGEGDQDDEPPSPSSSTQTLRSTLMGQFLPASLLDSPQVTPKHGRLFAGENLSEEKPSPEADIEALSLSEPPATSPIVEQQQGKSDVSDSGDGYDEPTETRRSESGRLVAAVSPMKLSMLSELFETISLDELESILQQFDGQESTAIEHILSTHPSFNPALAAGDEGSGSGPAPMASHSPSRSSTSMHGKASLHRSSSQGGVSGPPPGSSSNWKTEICMYYMQGKCNKTRRTCSFAHGESDLVRPTGSSSGSGGGKHGTNFKTRLCQAYENGTCPKSRRDCPMAHGVNDLRDGNAATSGSSGSQPMLSAATPRLQSYKTELCYYFLKGNCNYSKEECRFAHGQNDLRTVESNTAQIAAAAAGVSGYGGDFGPASPVPPPAVSIEKQLQIQHQYQQQYQQHHQPPSIPQHHGVPHSFQPQPPPAQQQPSFVPQHQLQLQHTSRGAGGAGGASHQFAFQHQNPGASAHPLQHQQFDMGHQQQQNPYMPSPGQYRYLKGMEDKRSSTSGARPPRRDSGSSWSSFDASGLPPAEF